jgi:transketolase
MNAPPAVLSIDTEAFALTLRRHVLRMCAGGGSAHVGSNLSAADIVAMLYGRILRIDPSQPKWPGRDRFVLSKGHACAVVYAALAERGFFPPETLPRHYSNGSIFAGHLTHKHIPGVEMSTGSLGHGLGVAAGMAFQLRRAGGDQRVFALLSDGECDEGSVWEAGLFAAHHRLSRLCAIIDYNKLQGIARVEETIALEPFSAKWRAFGWEVRQVDGHDHVALHAALDTPSSEGRPLCLIADTVKGRGVSFMEDSVLWHYRVPAGEEYAAALRELSSLDA